MSIVQPSAVRCGTIHGVGLGPGACDLMSVRADRLVRGARHIAYFRKAGRSGHARRIVDGMLRDDVTEFAMEYPVTTEIAVADPRYNDCLSAFYAGCIDHLAGLVRGGEDVVVLCEGDPFFYGSFMHLYTRLQTIAPVCVVPGITGMSGAWTASGAPITWGDDVLTILPATLPAADLAARLATTDAAVIMKLGRHLPKVRAALHEAGLLARAVYVERGTMAGEHVVPLADKPDDAAPYFSMVLVPGEGRRP